MLVTDDNHAFGAVPEDFPCAPQSGSVAGAQPKIPLTKYKDRFYALGCTPPEIFARWEICEDLAVQLAEKATESKAGKRAHMTEIDILDQYLARLIRNKWTSQAEAKWIIRRVANMLTWPATPAAI